MPQHKAPEHKPKDCKVAAKTLFTMGATLLTGAALEVPPVAVGCATILAGIGVYGRTKGRCLTKERENAMKSMSLRK